MIRVVDVYKKFDDQIVLNGVSTEFANGNVSLIIGASGSGKTVLLKSIIGLVKPDSGEIYYDDTPTSNLNSMGMKRIRMDVGMLFQQSALFDFATAGENIKFPMDFFTEWTEEEKWERVNFCLKRVGLENIGPKQVSDLSGGMQKRVGIARAIALNPKYLLCDEPNSGLDPQTSIKIDQLISEITKEYNITTIVNTHDMNSVMEIGDSINFICQGTKRWEGNKNDIFHSDCEELNKFIFASKMALKLKSLL